MVPPSLCGTRTVFKGKVNQGRAGMKILIKTVSLVTVLEVNTNRNHSETKAYNSSEKGQLVKTSAEPVESVVNQKISKNIKGLMYVCFCFNADRDNYKAFQKSFMLCYSVSIQRYQGHPAK
jgi:Ribonuclease G/E